MCAPYSNPDPKRTIAQAVWIRLLALALTAGLTACHYTEVRRHDAPKTASPPTAKSAVPSASSADTAVAPDTLLPPSTSPLDASPGKTQPSSTPGRGSAVAYSPNYDTELRAIIDLTKRKKWEEAEARASALYALDPTDSSVQRVYKWVQTEGPKRREKALEDKIRDVSSRDSRFNPTVKSILTEKKSQGLPPRSDLREAIEQINATPYIPENFGKTVKIKGNLEDFESPKGRMAQILDKEIEVHLDNVSLENIIFQVGQAEGINFIADKSIPAFQKKLSVNLNKSKLSEFLSYVERNLDVQFQVGGDLIWITDAKDTNKVMQETRFYKLRKGFVLPARFGVSDPTTTRTTANNVTTVTEVQKFQNFVPDAAAKEPAIEVAIKKFFKGSKYQIDREHNIIIARGTAEQLRILDQIIEEFDRPIQQVLIEARFITVTEAAFLQLGVAWETGQTPLLTPPVPVDYTGLGSRVGLGLQESWTGVLGRKNLSATLTALDQSGESETISAPRVTLINNLPASISDGTIQYYYDQYTVSQTILATHSSSSLVPQGKPTKITSGVTLDVVASVGGDGKAITLALQPKVSQNVTLATFATVTDRDQSGNISGTFNLRLPQWTEQSLATRVVVKSGQTVVMGGVSQRVQTHFVEAVPVLGRIPLIGAMFRRRTEVDAPRYLLIFVTATLLSESGEFIVSADSE